MWGTIRLGNVQSPLESVCDDLKKKLNKCWNVAIISSYFSNLLIIFWGHKFSHAFINCSCINSCAEISAVICLAPFACLCVPSWPTLSLLCWPFQFFFGSNENIVGVPCSSFSNIHSCKFINVFVVGVGVAAVVAFSAVAVGVVARQRRDGVMNAKTAQWRQSAKRMLRTYTYCTLRIRHRKRLCKVVGLRLVFFAIAFSSLFFFLQRQLKRA